MVPEYNAPSGYRVRKTTEQQDNRPGRAEAADRAPHAHTKATEKTIDVIFNLNSPGQAAALEGHRAAFGEDHCEVEELGDGNVVLRLYPGGARRPM